MGADAKRQHAYDVENQERQNDWQSEENEKDRQWQSAEWLRQFGLEQDEADRRFRAENTEWDRRFGSENDEWQRRFDEQNAYNDPSAMVERLRRAGINPAAALGQLTGSGGLAAAGGSSSPTSSDASYPGQPGTSPMASHAVTPMGLNPVPPAGVNVRDIMSSLRDLSDSAAGISDSTLRREYQSKTMGSVLRKYDADINKTNAQTTALDLQNAITNAYGNKQAAVNILRDIAQIGLYYQEGKLKEAQTLTEGVKAELFDTKNLKEKASLPYISQLFMSMIDNYKASANASNAAADLSKAKTATENVTRPYVVQGLRLDNVNKDLLNQFQETSNYIATLNKNVAVNTYSARLDAEFNKYEREGLLNEELCESIKGLIKENKFKEASMMMQLILQGTQSFDNVTEGVGNTIRIGASMRTPKTIGFGN